MEQDRIISLGGSGEDSRSCFFACLGKNRFLLDCGVRRELHSDIKRVYPLLTPAIAHGLTAVFLSHAHEDHAAALPYLYEMGYRGPVYATPETLAQVPGCLEKWASYVKQGRDILPFDAENAKKIDFRSLPLGDHSLYGCQIRTGRSGHVPGSVWFHVTYGTRTLLYTGDFTFDGRLLAWDMPPAADTVIMECAYANRRILQQTQYKFLLHQVRETLQNGGKALLPVPANGRGVDILDALSESGFPIFVEESILKSADALAKAHEWRRRDLTCRGRNIHCVNERTRRAAVDTPGGAVYLFPDGMLSTSTARFYFNRCKADSRSLILITGHAAEGTVGSLIFQSDYRAESGVSIRAEQCTIKVHLDQRDALTLAKKLRPKRILLFHAEKEDCRDLIRLLTRQGIQVFCGPPGKGMEG